MNLQKKMIAETVLTDSKILYKSQQALPLIVMDTADFYGVVALQGAQILEFKVKNQDRDLLWLSPKAIYESGKAIRGGIPLCAPWFGIHKDPAKPKHGFVRNAVWDVLETEKQGKEVILMLGYHHTADPIFPFSFKMTYTMRFSEALHLDLQVENVGKEDMPFSWAFHSYHPVSDLGVAQVEGLSGIEYLDATQNFKRMQQEGRIVFQGEVDRVYENVPAEQIILDKCSLSVIGENCPTAIVWNPGETLASKMADVEEGYVNYICVERGAAFGNSWNIAPGQKQAGKLTIQPK